MREEARNERLSMRHNLQPKIGVNKSALCRMAEGAGPHRQSAAVDSKEGIPHQ